MTRMLALGLVTLCLNIVAPVAGASYDIVKDFAGSSFFDDWDFFGSCECFLQSNNKEILRK